MPERAALNPSVHFLILSTLQVIQTTAPRSPRANASQVRVVMQDQEAVTPLREPRVGPRRPQESVIDGAR